MTVGDLIWLSIPNSDYVQLDSNLANSLGIANLGLSFATNAVATMLIAYRLWYVAVSGIHWVQWLTVE